MDYVKIPTTLEAIDAERDKPSYLGIKLGLGEHKREGVVFRPLVEMRRNNDRRIMSKHKNAEFMETKTPREVSPEKLMVLENAQMIATEWVTPMRLEHVLDAVSSRLGIPMDELGMDQTGEIVKEMIADVLKESVGEIEWSKESQKAVGSMAAKLWIQKMKEALK